MQVKKIFAVTLSLLMAVLLCSLSLPQEEKKPVNLKVLPKNISHEELDKIMHGYKQALGVKCNFCHAASKTDPKKLDFASDEKEEKETARDMMRMTKRINKKFFKGGTDEKGQPMMTVTCYTCHHGNEEPGKMPEEKEKGK